MTDVFIGPHCELEAATLRLCQSLAPAVLYRLLRGAHLGMINYAFWTVMYTRFVQPHFELVPVQTSLASAPNVVLSPHASSRLRASPDNDTVLHWRRAWFLASVASDDIALFHATCARLGYGYDIIAPLMGTPHGRSLGLDMTTLCTADACALVTEFAAWKHIMPSHVGQMIIPNAPRLRAALCTRGYKLPCTELADTFIIGAPADIVPFLPTTTSPLLITDMPLACATSCFVLALLQQWRHPLSIPYLYRLFQARVVQRGNLLNFILPVERRHEAGVRAQIRQLDEEWGRGLGVSPRLLFGAGSEEWSTYGLLYRLFLVYWLERSSEPCVPFDSYHVDSRRAVVLPEQAHGRLFTFARAHRPRFSPLLPAVRIGDDIVAYLTAGLSVTVCNVTGFDNYNVYDCDISWPWLLSALAERGYAPSTDV